MKLEINITNYHFNLLKKISEYSGIDLHELAKGILINHIERFDSEMEEFLEQNLPDDYYNEMY